MEIRLFDKFCILTPLAPKLDAHECRRLYEEIKNYDGFQVGIDLSFVQDCTIEFIEELYKLKSLNIFNIPSDIFTLFNMMNVDKYTGLFVSEEDFLDNKYRLVNRKFSLVQSA